MACNQSQQEWTIDMVINPPTPESLRTLVFCLNVGDTITGNVDILSQDGEAEALSTVTGLKRVQSELVNIPEELRPALMTLNFTWGDTQVVLSGNTFANGTQNRFAGHFRALASNGSDPAPNPPTEGGGNAPSVNDTGTGTGTQT